MISPWRSAAYIHVSAYIDKVRIDGLCGLGIAKGNPGVWRVLEGVWKDYYSVILELMQLLYVIDQKLPKDHCLTLSKAWDK
jgi:hypothetical protein